MNITPIDSVGLSTPILESDGPSASSVHGRGFMDAVGAGLQSLNGDVNTADTLAKQVAAGDKVPLHDVMIAFEQAHLKLQMAVEIRNRVVDAYQNLTNMQL